MNIQVTRYMHNIHRRMEDLPKLGRVAPPRACMGGLGACSPPPKKIFKWCNLVCFEVYFDKILTIIINCSQVG